MQVTTGLSDAVSRYLDMTSAELKLTAGNMANVDTPGYRTQGFNFEQEMMRAMQAPLDAPLTPNVSAVDGLVSRPDGNNVSMDRESMQLAKEQLQFRFGVTVLRSEFTRVMSAIHAEAK
ncbi:MAG: flagellar biosynthesis protein FlgB [Acidobacteriota bacterium]|nr:flagellar biosynthesis protein FlgB [Acidobacteriota bacterium]